LSAPIGPLLVRERHDDFRRHAGNEVDVARVGRDVVHEQRHLAVDRGADEPAPALQRASARRCRVAHGVRRQQLAAPLVEQVHGEGVELDEARDQLRDLREQLSKSRTDVTCRPRSNQGREHLLLTPRS
jgi:hypothetical protein